MPQYATGKAAKEAGVRARFLFHFSFAVRFSVFRLHINAAHDYHAGVWIGFREHAQP